MTDQTDQTVPAAQSPAPSWAQPPEAGAGGSAGWAQPPGPEGRRLYGSTEAASWQPNEQLAAQEAAAAADAATKVSPQPANQPHSYPSAPRVFTPTVQKCPKCGGDIDWDGYCELCGAKAPSVREHFEEQPASWVGGVCDRGIRHSRNEDALALEATVAIGGRAALVVCDGVSMSTDSDQASLAAARAAIGFVAGQHDWDWNLIDLSESSPTRQLLTQTAQVANQAVLDHSDLTEASPASCTLAVGLVAGRQLLAATLGDSRVYWLPDTGAAALLSTDDSMAQEQIAAGVDRLTAETGIHGHVITKWLGRDAPDVTPNLSATLAEGPGWLLVCSDGLWNYASDPAAMNQLVQSYSDPADVEVLGLARRLVAWANEQGGHDNITVALARVDQPVATAEPGSPADDLEAPTTRIQPVDQAGTPAS